MSAVSAMVLATAMLARRRARPPRASRERIPARALTAGKARPSWGSRLRR
jgi:hypothetical protein